MSKTILQEIATFQALETKNQDIYNELRSLSDELNTQSESTKTILNKASSDFQSAASLLKQEFSNDLAEQKIATDKVRMTHEALENFTIQELSNNYKALGTMRREYRRSDDLIKESINELSFRKLEYFTGPISTPVYDSNGNVTGYTSAIAETSRDWIYILSRAIKYKGSNLLSLNSALTTITLGDANYNKVQTSGSLTVATDCTITNGTLSITSSGVNSITCNKDITTAGGILAGGNINTSKGNISTAEGDISTSKGNLYTTSGDIYTSDGSVKATKGLSTTNGDITTGTGNISTNTGNISISNGDFKITTSGNISTKLGNISTDRGYIKTAFGNISTDQGDISTTLGNISSGSGNISTGSGNITTANGKIQSDRGDLVLQDGRIIVGGTTGTKMLFDNGNLTISGGANIAGSLTAKDLNILTDLSARNLTLTGVVNSSGTGTNSFAGPIDAKAIGCTNINATGDISARNISTSGTLTVNGTTTFNANVTAGTYTMTASKFIGLATSANYADLAEKYKCDRVLAPGTVVAICMDDTKDYEIELYTKSSKVAAGVVSTAPGLMLNDNENTTDDTYLFVALKGRIPVKCTQEIKKGMFVYPDPVYSGRAYGTYEYTPYNLLGIALSNSANGTCEIKV